jgi:hypothetical protein
MKKNEERGVEKNKNKEKEESGVGILFGHTSR